MYKPGIPWFKTLKKHGDKAEIQDDLIYEQFLEFFIIGSDEAMSIPRKELPESKNLRHGGRGF